MAQAAALGYSALAITDECSVAGVVRAHGAAKEHSLKLIIGSEFRLSCGLHLVVLATSRRGYGGLCELISIGRRSAPKGQYRLGRGDFVQCHLLECLALWVPGDTAAPEQGQWIGSMFPDRSWLGVQLLAAGDDRARLQRLSALGEQLALPLVACGDVHMHVRGRRALQDTLTAIRLKCTVASAGLALFPNGERHLRPPQQLMRIYPQALLGQTVEIAGRCQFSLDELRYEYPHELVPDGETASSYLRRLTLQGMAQRWPQGVPVSVQSQVEYELKLISELAYEPFFLTVHDVVHYARSQGILCQGRGSAANSAVCYCLKITAVDPGRMSMLFERFISKERNEPPDIDVDFEHERREEVIQYIYTKYGRQRAALAATVISYRPRSALRDVGKALGFDPLQLERLSGAIQWWDGSTVADERVREAGFDPHNTLVQRLLILVRTVLGFPRHLSQHVGGFVISEGPLNQLVPVENASMPERTVIQWDKDDLEALGLLKVDVLALGMLSAIRRAFDLVGRYRRLQRPLTLASVPSEDPKVYDMICEADTVGVFQIESRAQMSMLPRLRPRNYYDLVIEVAIVRPGPIQGDMVHPYLRRRNGEEAVSYPSDAVREVLERTLGVPIFQEQVMQLAVVAAGFTPGEADRLRRAMAAWKRQGGLGPFEDKLIRGMRERGYTQDFAQRIFRQITGFGEYGFPESHSASFALLVYVSAWLKCHEPAAFAAALINSQPMGFYAPSQLIQDARRHGVQVRAVDVLSSDWDCTLERTLGGAPALRLGLRTIKGLTEEAGEQVVQLRRRGTLTSVQALATGARLNKRALDALAAADALRALAGHRHRARWDVSGIEQNTDLLADAGIAEGIALLRRPSEGQSVVADYSTLGFTLRSHPLALLRTQLDKRRIHTSQALWELPNGCSVRTAGLVTTRQRPGTASGVTFVTLEDEAGHVNIIVWSKLGETQRKVLLGAQLMMVRGTVQRESGVLHIVAARLEDYSSMLGGLVTQSRDFR